MVSAFVIYYANAEISDTSCNVLSWNGHFIDVYMTRKRTVM